MKRINKSQPPNELTAFAAAYPDADWDNDFRNHAVPPHSSGHDYKSIKQRTIEDQGGLCAYCEKQINNMGVHLQRIEHFHPKSDTSNPATNWGLLWSNILAVCTGGEHEDKVHHPLPVNLSCDAHKNYWIEKTNVRPENIAQFIGQLLNPLHLPPFPCPFDFDKQSGKLIPDVDVCAQIDSSSGSTSGGTLIRARETIKVLNLNCDRLNTERLLVLTQYNQEVAKSRKNKDSHFRTKLASKWFSSKWPSFFTTRRILLGDAAEQHLKSIGYSG